MHRDGEFKRQRQIIRNRRDRERQGERIREVERQRQ